MAHYTHSTYGLPGIPEQPRLRPSLGVLDEVVRKPKQKWTEPSWWHDDYYEIPGARLYTEEELKAKLQRLRCKEIERQKPKKPRTAKQITASRIYQLRRNITACEQGMCNARAQILLLESLNTSPTLPRYEKIRMPEGIYNLHRRIADREERLAEWKEELNKLQEAS